MIQEKTTTSSGIEGLLDKDGSFSHCTEFDFVIAEIDGNLKMYLKPANRDDWQYKDISQTDMAPESQDSVPPSIFSILGGGKITYRDKGRHKQVSIDVNCTEEDKPYGNTPLEAIDIFRRELFGYFPKARWINASFNGRDNMDKVLTRDHFDKRWNQYVHNFSTVLASYSHFDQPFMLVDMNENKENPMNPKRHYADN